MIISIVNYLAIHRTPYRAVGVHITGLLHHTRLCTMYTDKFMPLLAFLSLSLKGISWWPAFWCKSIAQYHGQPILWFNRFYAIDSSRCHARMPLSVVDASRGQVHTLHIAEHYGDRFLRGYLYGVPRYSTLNNTKLHSSVVIRYGFHRDFSRKLALKFI